VAPLEAFFGWKLPRRLILDEAAVANALLLLLLWLLQFVEGSCWQKNEIHAQHAR
jgi:hypothetical protein